VTRRQLLSLPAAGVLPLSAQTQTEPRNLSYPLRMVEGTLTSPNFLFLRSHFTEPEISLEDWRLTVEGLVNHPQAISFADLLELPTREVEAVLECAGNTAGGSAVSNVKWQGASLADLLKSAGVQSQAKFVMLEGADQGRLVTGSASLPYTQLMPIEKCLDPTSLIAFKINDRFLPRGNGFPARAVFPGWYAMDSVKWLRRIVVLSDAQQAEQFFQSGMNRVYNRTVKTESAPLISRLTAIQVKSVIAWPQNELKLPSGKHDVWGFAWTGRGTVRTVSVSTDGGETWNAGTLQPQTGPQGWRRWTYSWTARPGDAVLLSRASDDQGNEQPLRRDLARKDSYELNWCLPVRCSVR
jgi:DMSO/TMAO reductase YedYZ molybdopterin-dependent catalytic subunit